MGNLPDRIERLTNKSANFYASIGPFLSRREIVEELGAPIWDDDDKVWYLLSRHGIVIGFAAVRAERTLCSAYVLPEHRKCGAYSTLLKARLDDHHGHSLRAVATPSALHALRRAGFKAKAKRGRYTVMEIEA